MSGGDGLPLPEAARRAAELLQRLTPGLAQLDRSVVKAELWISTIREEVMGGFGIPTEIVAAAAAAQLEISVSVLILLEDDDDGDGGNTGTTRQADKEGQEDEDIGAGGDT